MPTPTSAEPEEAEELFATFCLKESVQQVSNSYVRKKVFYYTTAPQMKAAKQSHIQLLKRNHIYEGEAGFKGVNQS